jgi:hypothetical protein
MLGFRCILGSPTKRAGAGAAFAHLGVSHPTGRTSALTHLPPSQNIPSFDLHTHLYRFVRIYMDPVWNYMDFNRIVLIYIDLYRVLYASN